uniref:Uncharacterized protein n=1 Tax=Haemonchus contortus TaxID=6289 RepID=A0A7I4Z0Y3_HAECO
MHVFTEAVDDLEAPLSHEERGSVQEHEGETLLLSIDRDAIGGPRQGEACILKKVHDPSSGTVSGRFQRNGWKNFFFWLRKSAEKLPVRKVCQPDKVTGPKFTR